jgi:hypothetical protein
MLEKGIKITEQFTKPLLSISRKLGSQSIEQDSATIFFINEFGFALTSGDIIDKFFPETPYYEKYEKFKHEVSIPNTNIDELKLKYGYCDSSSIIELKTIFLDCAETITSVSSVRHPHHNIGLLYLENATNLKYESFAKFINPEKITSKGNELMRLGYPFPHSSNYLFNSSLDQIEWDINKPFLIDSFPIKGMITRLWKNPEFLEEIEMSTPGYKGHEGSPLFNEDGHIYGIHTTNSAFNQHDDKNYPNAIFGRCISSNIITDFLKELGVKFYQIENGKEVVYNENNTLSINPPQLVPTFYIAGDGESSLHVSQVKMIVGDKVVVDYNEPLKVAVGKTDEHSKKDGMAHVQFSIDGRNEIFITEENAGNVKHTEKNNNYELKVSKKVFKSENWKVKASVKNQFNLQYYYFDLLVIRRNKNQERDHIKDPHITFYPDASGKYIRYDNEKSIKITTKKNIKDVNSNIIPLHSKIEADEFEIDITYSLDNNVLNLSDLILKEKD